MKRLQLNWDLTRPSLLLRAEGVAALVLTLVMYAAVGASWWIFILLILWPDLALLAYLTNERAGAIAYNAVHTYIVPALLFAFGFLLESQAAMAFALIWAAHIGADRALGFGLKYRSARRPTHLQRVT